MGKQVCPANLKVEALMSEGAGVPLASQEMRLCPRSDGHSMACWGQEWGQESD